MNKKGQNNSNWKTGKLENWKTGKLENWKTGKLENWKTGKLENWKTGKLENWKTGKLENWKTGSCCYILATVLTGCLAATPLVAQDSESSSNFLLEEITVGKNSYCS